MSKNREHKKGISLLKKGQSAIVRAMFSRLAIILLFLLVSFALLFLAFWYLGDYLPHFWGVSVAFTAVMVLYLINTNMDYSAKATWLIVIMLMPAFGALLFWYSRSDLGNRTLKSRFARVVKESKKYLPSDDAVTERLAEEAPDAAGLAHYLKTSGNFPAYADTAVTYFPSGEAKFDALLDQLEAAESFIFMEYFIIEEGVMWGEILEVLARKAAEGVDVRVMFDGTVEITKLSHDYKKRLGKLGIKAKMFSPAMPFASTHYNYRDHRKITVIDGHTAFTGGVNLADEYINRKVLHGYWKDTAVMLRGSAVKSFTHMFLCMWALDERNTEFAKYIAAADGISADGAGFVIPYADCPLDSHKTGENVYIDILGRARKYVHIMTPYLILDGVMEKALKFAAERGVDVKLILPGIPDKKVAYALAKTHYKTLLDAGVKIYEYTPGFVHAKVFAADDREAVVGTINLDYRSLYHHFECAAYMCGTPAVYDIEADFADTLAKCREVNLDTVKHEKLSVKLMGFLAKVIAPLM